MYIYIFYRQKYNVFSFVNIQSLLLLLQVELVDMHYGTDKDPLTDPQQYWDHIHEIRACHKISRGCFFLVNYLQNYTFTINLRV